MLVPVSTDPIVLAAIPVHDVHMLPPGLLEFKMAIALLAEVVILVMYVVLLEGVIVHKPSFTSVTVCHDCEGRKIRA